MSLTPTTLSTLASTLLPPNSCLPSPISALALLIHAIHTALDFRLSPSASSDSDDGTPNRLPEGWETHETTKLKYRHDQSSLEFVLSVSELGGRGVINAVVVQDHKTKTFDLLLSDYFSASSFPTSPTSTTTTFDFGSLFSASNRLQDLITLYRINILQPLIPGLRKEGYSELPSTSSSGNPSGSGSGGQRQEQVGGRRGYYPDPGGPLIGGGGFDPFPPRGGGFNPPPPPPNFGGGGGGRLPGIGRDDLLPLGGRGGTFGGLGGGGDPLRLPGTGGMGGGFGGGGGGMFMGPEQFRDRFGGAAAAGGGGGGGHWGGDGFLPQGAVPPGARFDPIGPVNGPPQPGGVGIGGQQGPRGPIRGGPGSRDPDWDDVRPPGNSGNEEWRDSMFG